SNEMAYRTNDRYVEIMTDERTDERAETASGDGWGDGFRIGLGLGTATFVLALSFGALAREQGWSVLQTVTGSVLVFSGSAQFALLTGLAGGGAVAAVAAAVLV